MACTQVNAEKAMLPQGHWNQGPLADEFWEFDFIEIKQRLHGYNKYFLVFINTVLGWVEAFPTSMETAQIVAKKLMMEIIPRFGLFLTLGSDNVLAFMTKLSQMTSKALSMEAT